MPISTATGLFMGNANIRPLNPKRCLYHADLLFMASHTHQHQLSLTSFGLGVPKTPKEYERILLKHRTNNTIQINFTLHEHSEVDWLPACSQ